MTLNITTIWLVFFVAAFLPSCANQGDVAQQSPISITTAGPALGSREVDLSAFLPTGATLRLSARGDIDADGDDDALVVYNTPSSTAYTPRTLMILLRDADGMLRHSVASANAIMCRNCGGMMGDPLQQIKVGRGEFTLRFEGGSRELWASEFRFEYAHDRRIWQLVEVVSSALDRNDGKAAVKRQGSADFGDISLEEFDASSFLADALP